MCKRGTLIEDTYFFKEIRSSPIPFGGSGNARLGFLRLAVTARGGGLSFPSFRILSIAFTLLWACEAFVALAPNLSTKSCKTGVGPGSIRSTGDG